MSASAGRGMIFPLILAMATIDPIRSSRCSPPSAGFVPSQFPPHSRNPFLRRINQGSGDTRGNYLNRAIITMAQGPMPLPLIGHAGNFLWHGDLSNMIASHAKQYGAGPHQQHHEYHHHNHLLPFPSRLLSLQTPLRPAPLSSIISSGPRTLKISTRDGIAVRWR
jgi:hypothetical protein